MVKDIDEVSAKITFDEREVRFIKENRLGRIATVSSNMQPHVVPVAFEFDGHYFYFGGWNLKNSLKFKNILQNNKVAFVIDDLVSINPWKPRGIEIKGIAEILRGNDYVKIIPSKKSSWGING
ncbi:MAG: PPOX class F420-dependent oxidoreductase [Thermoproteota archaeon]|nr:PPOX class F420-dependent oxidoreductase [Thermoproteota archaeon]